MLRCYLSNSQVTQSSSHPRERTRELDELLLAQACRIDDGTIITAEDAPSQRAAHFLQHFFRIVILENRADLDLSREQFTEIRAAVVEVQGNIAGHEWDMQQAYLRLIEALDEQPIDEDAVLEHAMTAM